MPSHRNARLRPRSLCCSAVDADTILWRTCELINYLAASGKLQTWSQYHAMPTISNSYVYLLNIFYHKLIRSRLAVFHFTVRRSALHGICYRNSVRPSVCLSVCPSVTLVDCVHTVRPTIMIFSPYGSPIILVSGDITFIPKFEGGHPERWR